jgi:hypothetical protein
MCTRNGKNAAGMSGMWALHQSAIPNRISLHRIESEQPAS